MKTNLYDSAGKKKSEVNLPKIFDTKIRQEIVAKYFEADKFPHPHATMVGAGMRHSASGTISHKRHDWKGHYGRGISRVPRKTMNRTGTQFFWVGANAPGTRGGRRAHAPKGIGKEKKMNKKEIEIAFNSAFAATAHSEFIVKRYASLEKFEHAPVVVESIPQKTKSLREMLESVYGNNLPLVMKNKTVRAGKGKLRGRKYKSNAGVLIVVGKNENKKMAGFDIKTKEEVSISDLYPLGRLTIYTQSALKEMEETK